MVANLDELDHGSRFKMSVRPDGSFTMKNQRTGFTKEYPAVKDISRPMKSTTSSSR